MMGKAVEFSNLKNAVCFSLLSNIGGVNVQHPVLRGFVASLRIFSVEVEWVVGDMLRDGWLPPCLTPPDMLSRCNPPPSPGLRLSRRLTVGSIATGGDLRLTLPTGSDTPGGEKAAGKRAGWNLDVADRWCARRPEVARAGRLRDQAMRVGGVNGVGGMGWSWL